METLKSFKFKKGEKARFQSIIYYTNQEILKRILNNSTGETKEEIYDLFNAYAGLNILAWMLSGKEIKEEEEEETGWEYVIRKESERYKEWGNKSSLPIELIKPIPYK